MPPDWQQPDLDAEETTKFEPNLLNTSVYLISLSMQVSTFFINYQGRPFRESMRENRPLYFSLCSLLAVAVLGAAQALPELNATVELVTMESDFSDLLVKAILFDFACAFGIEYVSSMLFSDNRPHLSLGLNDPAWEKMVSGHSKRVIDKDGEIVVGPSVMPPLKPIKK